MILGERGSLNDGNSSRENNAFSSSSGEIIDTSTPRRGRSISYLELTSPFNDSSILSDNSLQRMRSLSQSINDLKILREKRQERRHEMGDLLNDDFLHEHAKKLSDARMKIKELEAKYQHPKRARKFDVSSLEKSRSLSFGLENRNEDSAFSGNTGDEKPDGYCGSTQVHNGITPVHKEAMVNTRGPRKLRPLTWASDNFSYSSESNSLSSFGSNRQRMMEIIPENADRNRNYCCNGYEGEPGTTENEQATAHNLIPKSNQKAAAKWRSMPNLSTNKNIFLENQKLMYGEAIPIDPTRATKKHNTKFGRKSGFYTVNESPEKSSNSSTKKRKFREKLFRRKEQSKKKSRKPVSSPTEGLTLGKIVRCHPSVVNAYIIELNKPDNGTFGFQIHKGHEEHEDGIFVCKIEDKKTEKFLSGLLHVGDEILEINKTHVKGESETFVQELVENADKLELSILPYTSRTEVAL